VIPTMETLADIASRSLVVALLCAAFYWMMRNRSASERHVLLTAAQLALLALPVAFFLAPKWQAPFGWERHVQLPSLAVVVDSVPVTAAAPTVDWVPILWAVGCALVVLRAAYSLLRVAGVKATCRPLRDGGLRSRVEAMLRGKKVQVIEGTGDSAPMTWGWLRPVVVIPPNASQWPDSQLQSVISHELAHVERADWITQLLANFVCAVYWFNPLVWYLAKRMRTESEQAADDRVLSQGCKPEDYALHLLGVARSVRRSRSVGAVAMAGESPIGQRLTAILSENRRRSAQSRIGGLMMIGAGCMLACGVAAAAPKQILEMTPIPVPTQIVEAEAPVPPAPDVTVELSKPAVRAAVENHPRRRNLAQDVIVHETPKVDASAVVAKRSAPAVEIKSCPDAKLVAQAPTKPAAAVTAEDTAQTDKKIDHEIAQANAELAASLKELPAGIKVSNLKIPNVDVSTPDIHVDVPSIEINGPAFHVKVPAIKIHLPKMHMHISGRSVQCPKSNCDGDDAADDSADD
jgi:beta-lactamase regulating signal transducer with metallopeptidase domain